MWGCALRPGLPGVSDNIEVRSILGRFLEHSRVWVFGGAGDPVAYIGSADMMHRNLDRRVEALVELNPRHTREVMNLLERGMSDRYAHWRLGSDGRWVRRHVGPDGPLDDLQADLIEMYAKRRRKAAR